MEAEMTDQLYPKGKMSSFPELRRALLCWYPFECADRALLLGENTEAFLPLLQNYFSTIDTIDPTGTDLPDSRLQPYDCVIAIDYLERNVTDVSEWLKTVNRLLKPEGLLLLGFRNRFGLRYLCGGMDDYVQTPFSGLAKDTKNSAVLFSRHEVNQFLQKTGFMDIRYYYPMPDSDFTQAVFTDDRLPETSFRDRVFPYDPYESPWMIPEIDLYDDMVYEGTLPQAANYYLVECRKQPDNPWRKKVIYTALSADRGAERSFATVLFSDDTVQKRPLSPEGIPALHTIYRNLEHLRSRGLLTVDQKLTGNTIEMPLVREEALLSYMKRSLTEDPDAFLAVFSEIWEDILRSSEPGILSEDEALRLWELSASQLSPVLEKGYIDMIPYNIFRAGSSLRYYDQEFVVENCPAKYILFRAIYFIWFHHLPEAEQVFPVEEVKARFGLTDLWESFLRRELRFVSDNRNWKVYQLIHKWSAFDRPACGERRRRLRDMDYARTAAVLIDEVHNVQLGLLQEFDRVCVKHGLQYFAIHGTLLGAVRHHGFIPWDDDLDFAMLREDYDRLVQLAPFEFREPYFFQTPESDPTCFYGGYAKLRDSRTAALETQNLGKPCNQGIWIDILPLDRCPASPSKRAALQKRLTLIQRLYYAKLYKQTDCALRDVSGARISFYYIFKRLFSNEDLLKLLYRQFTSCRETGCRAILAGYTGSRRNRSVYAEADLEQTVRLPFENMQLCVPANYDSWLRKWYGDDYMQIPPPEKRHGHGIVAFYTDRSFRDLKTVTLTDLLNKDRSWISL